MMQSPWPRSALLLALAVSVLEAAEARAQTTADSAAVGRALGAALRGQARAVFGDVACSDGAPPCATARPDSTHPVAAELARVAGARLGRVDRAGIPPCPWGYKPPRPDAGYVVRVARIHWSARHDVAYVLLLSSCDNPPGYLHDVFGQDDDYEVVRGEGGVWRVAGKTMTRITRRDPSLHARGTPGD